ncbi:hypothetical protein [Microbacterium sp. SS28]|uniref:hypothetical protein n=1 Tax=Microbacterium sp. SS28 TaxID=2919948 RepID=UPI001FA9EC12|nr:hypothetical protein [Microbacterium sp. SS28]
MADASDDASRPAARKEQPDDQDAANERARESNRRYRQAHPDRHAASARRWKEAHPERVRELNRLWRAENLERSRELNRESMRRTAARKRQLLDKRRRSNEASKRWKEAHPDHVREYHRRWQAANPDKVTGYLERYRRTHREELNRRATAWRDLEPDKMKAARKAWADRNKERTAEIQRKRRNDPEKYRADLDKNNAAKRLAHRLERAGLPPKELHRTTAAERRANDRAAAAYFNDPVLSERLRQFARLTQSLTEHMVAHGGRFRAFAHSFVATRSRMGLPPVDVEQVVWARAVEIVTERMKRVDLLTSRDVAAAVRSARSNVAVAARERRAQQLWADIEAHVHRNRLRLLEEAGLENAMRVRSGKATVPVERIVALTALDEVLEAQPELALERRQIRQIVGKVQPGLAGIAQAFLPQQPNGGAYPSKERSL